MRGLTYARFGTTSLRTLNASSTAWLNAGAERKRLPSTRTPYCSCKPGRRTPVVAERRGAGELAARLVFLASVRVKLLGSSGLEIGERVERERSEQARRQVGRERVAREARMSA